MKRFTLSVILLALSVMACGMPVSASVNMESHINTSIQIATQTSTPVTTAEMTVAADMLNIRVSPGGEVVHFTYLIKGDRVTVYERQNDQYGYAWCRTGLHWVGCAWLQEVK